MAQMRLLANSLVNNGQFHLPPNDVIRQGVVIGYDPNYNSTTSAHAHATLTVTLAGDTTPVHGVRFAETYKPNLNDTVWCLLSGEDIWAMGRLSDTPTANNTVPAPSGIAMVGWTFGTLGQTTNGTETPQPVSLTASALTTPLLPNHLYKAEATVSFSITAGTANPQDAFLASWANGVTTVTVTNSYGATLSDWIGLTISGDGIPGGATIVTAPSATTGNITISANTTKAQPSATTVVVYVDHFLGLYVDTPDNSMTALADNGYQEIAQGRVASGASHTWSGSTLWYHKPTASNYPYNWTTMFPNANFTWHLGARAYSNGGSAPTAVFGAFTFAIYDLGIAS